MYFLFQNKLLPVKGRINICLFDPSIDCLFFVLSLLSLLSIALKLNISQFAKVFIPLFDELYNHSKFSNQTIRTLDFPLILSASNF